MTAHFHHHSHFTVRCVKTHTQNGNHIRAGLDGQYDLHFVFCLTRVQRITNTPLMTGVVNNLATTSSPNRRRTHRAPDAAVLHLLHRHRCTMVSICVHLSEHTTAETRTCSLRAAVTSTRRRAKCVHQCQPASSVLHHLQATRRDDKPRVHHSPPVSTRIYCDTYHNLY